MPVNYQMDVINPFQAALQGYGAGAQMLQQERQNARQDVQDVQQNQLFGLQMQDAQARAAKLQQETAAANERNKVYGDFFAAVQDKTLDMPMLAKVAAIDEKLGTFGTSILENVTADQKKAAFRNQLEPATALMQNDVPAAKANLETQRDALMNAGNEQGAKIYQNYIDHLGTPDGQAFVQASLLRGAMLAEPKQGDFKNAFENIKATQGEKETEAVRTAREYATTFGPPGSPAYLKAFQTKLLPPPAPGTVVNVGGTEKPLTEGQKAVDNKFAPIYAEFITGGASDAAKQVSQLAGALKQLQENKQLTGPLIGLMPETLQSFAAPEALAVKQTIQEVVQRNLRAVLGSQFTAKEGEALIARAFDPSLGQQENVKRVRRLLEQIERANADAQEAVKYYEKKGTLQGYQYNKPQLSDFQAAASGKGGAVTIDFKSMDDSTLLRQDVTKLTREQRLALGAVMTERGYD